MKFKSPLLKWSLAVFILFQGFIATSQLAANLGGNTSISVCEGAQAVVEVFITNATAPYEITCSDGTSSMIVSATSSPVLISLPTAINGMYNYTFSVEDANGEVAVASQQFSVQVNPLPPVNILASQTVVCIGDVIFLTPTGAMTYTWSNGVTNGLFTATFPGTQTLTVMGSSAAGCTNTAQTTITVLPSPAMNPPIAAIDSAYCNDGSISLTLPTPAPYSISWNNLSSTSPSLTGLAAGTYHAVISDTLGCTYAVSYTVPQSLTAVDCGTIKGNVNYDLDESCSITPGDTSSAFKIITANPGNYLAVSDIYGNYEFHLAAGTYTIQEAITATNVGAFCNPVQTVAVSPGQVVQGIDFMDTLSNEVDLYASGMLGQVRPNFNFSFLPHAGNLLPLNSLPNTQAWFVIPNGVDLVTWSHPHTISSDTVFFQVGNGNPALEPANFYASNIQLGDLVTFCTGIAVSPLEIDTTNNVQCISTIAIGSYDPNDKTTFVNGAPTNGTIYMEDQVLEYVIRFQNTGTADAINVSVLDTILETLDLSSFQLLGTSHTCNLILLENNTLKFDFPSIHLPDSTTNEPASHGFIRYRIRQKAGNTVGTVIKNTAYIYFDFNEAVITNTTHDLIVEPASLDKLTSESVQLYPNPTEGKVNVATVSAIRSITLYTMNGQELARYGSKGQQAVIDLSTLTNGIYLLKVETENGTALRKVHKM